METRKLGHSDLHLTTIGLGTWAIGGGDWRWGWGPQDEKESIATIHRALDLGINWLDTAPAYGLGRSEEVIAKAIAGRREKVIIATKCGLVWGSEKSYEVNGFLSAESVRKETEESLRRLNIDVIDLYQIHWPRTDEANMEAWATIADLIKEGKIRYAGVSNFSVEQLKLIKPIHPVASLQPDYSMLSRDPEDELLAYCAANDIGVVAYSPLRSGILTDGFNRQRLENLDPNDWRTGDRDFQKPRSDINLNFVQRLRTLASRHGRNVSQLAIAWVLNRPEVTSAIVGARKPTQIESSAPAAGWYFSDKLRSEIDLLLAEREQNLAEAG